MRISKLWVLVPMTVLILVATLLGGCGPVEERFVQAGQEICAQPEDGIARKTARNTAAHGGIYVKCIEPKSTWSDFELKKVGH